jgi:hypothetical protein
LASQGFSQARQACIRKQHFQKIKNAVPSKQAQRKPKQAQRPATLPFPPPATNGTRNQDSRTPDTPSNIEQSTSSKKGKLEHITNFLADQPLDNLDSLGNDELSCKLKTCISYLRDLERATVKLQHSLICQLECDVEAKKTEINDMHVKFSKHVDTILSRQNDPKPSYAWTVKEGASSGLVASFAYGEKPTEPLNVAAIERLLDVKSYSSTGKGKR